MINIDGLFIYDAEICLNHNIIVVDTQHDALIGDILALPPPIDVSTLNKGSAMIRPRNMDVVALAERIAGTWESQGYKIKRIVASEGVNRRIHTEVQSFILA